MSETALPREWGQHQRDVVYSLRRRLKAQQEHIVTLQRALTARNAEVARLTAVANRLHASCEDALHWALEIAEGEVSVGLIADLQGAVASHIPGA